ncbi:MAG: FAD-dependent oxidoreductase [Acidobacteriota bacterium]
MSLPLRTLTGPLLFVALSCAPAQETLRDDSTDAPDVVVVGGGLMGSSTAWQLARAGEKVLLLEKQGSVYTEGSSLGAARIARSLGPPGDVWSYLHNRTVAEVEELVAFLKERGDSVEMTDVYTTSPVNYVRHESRWPGYAYLPEQSDRYELATTPSEAAELFGLAMPEDVFLVRELEEHSGTIDPSALIGLLHRGILAAGGRVEYGREVERLTKVDGGYELSVSDGTSMETLRAVRVVSAAGPYTGRLLAEVAPAVDRLVKPERVFLAFFEVDEALWGAWSAEERQRLVDLFPAINSVVPVRVESAFSMIESRTEDGRPVIKIGGHFQRSDIKDLDSIWQQELSASEVDWARSALLRHLALLGEDLDAEAVPLVDGYSCVYSLTSDEVPYVTPWIGKDGAEDPSLVIVAGLSGVGAKGAMAYGVLAADLVLGRTESDESYVKARETLGVEHLRRDLVALSAAGH